MSRQQQAQEIETVRIPWLGNPTNRDTVTTKDQRFVNVYFDVLESAEGAKSYFLNKRPGYTSLSQPPAAAATGRGVYSWNGSLYSVFGTKIYKGTTDLGVTLTTSTGLCNFDESHPAAVTQQLCINDGAKLYAINTADTVTTISTIPANIRSLLYFDRYWFTLSANGALAQSDLDDPTTWSASKLIYSQMYNGAGIALGNQNNLLFALSSDHLQAFYDAANTSGSILTNVEQAAQQIGCASTDSLVFDTEVMIWVTNTKNGGYSVVKMTGSVNADPISTPGIDRVLRGEGTNISSCVGNLINIAGHQFYLLNLAGADRTLVYDLTSKNGLWLEWQAAGGSGKFPLVDFTQHSNTLVGQHATDGRIYTLSESATQDNGSSFTVLGRFKRFDLDDNVNKFVKTAYLIGDIQSSTTPVSLQYSDDDWVTLSTARTMDMADVNPMAAAMGKFKRRSWQISYSGANSLRLEALELKLRMGLV